MDLPNSPADATKLPTIQVDSQQQPEQRDSLGPLPFNNETNMLKTTASGLGGAAVGVMFGLWWCRLLPQFCDILVSGEESMKKLTTGKKRRRK